jgi:hypothetical protein
MKTRRVSAWQAVSSQESAVSGQRYIALINPRCCQSLLLRAYVNNDANWSSCTPTVLFIFSFFEPKHYVFYRPASFFSIYSKNVLSQINSRKKNS